MANKYNYTDEIRRSVDASLKANGFSNLNPEAVIFEDGSNLIQLIIEQLGDLYREGKQDEANTIISNTISAATSAYKYTSSAIDQLVLDRSLLIPELLYTRDEVETNTNLTKMKEIAKLSEYTLSTRHKS